MTLYVATLTGKTYDLPSVSLSDTIGGLKRRLQDMEGLPPDFQRWIFAGRYLEDGKTVEEVGLLPEGCKERPSIEELPPLAPGDTVDISELPTGVVVKLEVDGTIHFRSLRGSLIHLVPLLRGGMMDRTSGRVDMESAMSHPVCLRAKALGLGFSLTLEPRSYAHEELRSALLKGCHESPLDGLSDETLRRHVKKMRQAQAV